MLNNVELVGRILEEPTTIKTDNENTTTVIKLAIPRQFKNSEGEYETDHVSITLNNGIAKSANEYCNVGAVVGVKGRIQSIDNNMQIIGERLTFLQSKKSNE